MTYRSTARKLLTSATRVSTLVVIGVAETACNLQVGDYPDTGHTDTACDSDHTDCAETDTDEETDAAVSVR